MAGPSNIFADSAQVRHPRMADFPSGARCQGADEGTDGFKSASSIGLKSGWSRHASPQQHRCSDGAPPGIIVIDLDPRSGSGVTVANVSLGQALPETVRS